MGVAKEQRYCVTEEKLVMGERPTPNHLLHLVLSIVTGGLWVVIWIMTIVLPRQSICSSCGGRTLPPWRAPKAAKTKLPKASG
jgi:hypothetical protein